MLKSVSSTFKLAELLYNTVLNKLHYYWAIPETVFFSNSYKLQPIIPKIIPA